MESSIGRTNSSVNSSTTSKIKIPATMTDLKKYTIPWHLCRVALLSAFVAVHLPIDCLKTIVQAPAPSDVGNRALNMY